MNAIDTYIATKPLLSMALGSSFTAVLGFFLGLRIRIVSERIKRKDEAVSDFIAHINSEIEAIRFHKRTDGKGHSFHIQNLLLCHARAVRLVSLRSRNKAQMHWQRYENQIERSASDEFDGSLGYRNHLIAYRHLSDLKAVIEGCWT